MPNIVEENRYAKPSFTRSIIGGLAEGIPGAIQQYQEQKRQSQLMQAENEAAKRMGIDLSGFTDPKQRENVLKIALEGQQKQGLLGQKQNFLNQLFQGQSTAKNQNFVQQMQGQPSVQQAQLDPSDLSDEQIAQATAVDPNLGRALMHAKDVALREKREERNFQEQQRRTSPEFKREEKLTQAQAEADVKYNQELQASEKQHKLKSQTLDRLEKLNQKGVTGKPFEKILEKSGLINLTSEGRREFAADVKNLLTDIRSILGSQFSSFEFSTILNAFPSPDFSKEANSAIIKNLKDFQDIRSKEFEFARELKKENGGKLPPDYQARVNQALQEYVQMKLPEIKQNTQTIMAEEYGVKPGNILMFDPNGEPLDVSPDQVQQYESLGATLP